LLPLALRMVMAACCSRNLTPGLRLTAKVGLNIPVRRKGGFSRMDRSR
jgi:hypothetical protein